MSLIQEALKRQQKDPTGKAPAAGAPPAESGAKPPADAAGASPLKLKPTKPEDAAQGAVPTPKTTVIGGGEPAPATVSVMPPPLDEEPATRKRPKKPLIIALAAVLVLVVLGIGGFAVKTLLKGKEKPAPATPPASKPSTNATKAAKAPAEPAKKPEAAKPTPAKPVETAAPAKKPAVPTPAAKQPAEKPVASPVPQPAKTSIARPEPVKTVPKKEVVMWPILVVKGILGKGTQGNGGAIINNEIISVGQEIEGVKVVSVNPNGTITLEFKGEKKTLRSGDITN